MSSQLEPDFVESVVSHMNEDHSDALLAYVQAFGGKPNATSARLLDLDSIGMKISYMDEVGQGDLRVAFNPPITDANNVRAQLVQMVREARSCLAQRESDKSL